MDLAGNELVLDAGCGTGQVTSMLLDRLPRGRIVALDGSASMVAAALARLGRERVSYVVADLLESLPVRPSLDAILSTATFHWISDHDRLFRNLAEVLRPGGRLEAQFGGSGNVASIVAILADLGVRADWGKVFPTAEETASRLEAAGFDDVRCWLHPEPATIPAEDLERYLRTVCLGGVLERMDERERSSFVREVAARMPRPVLDYVRLDVSARRAIVG
jgi:trans-aconitate 2-methyltransferase